MISVIGCGYWGKNLIKTFGELGVLFSVHDINQSVQQQFTTEYNLESISFEEMLKSESVKGVVIATTAETHFKLAKQALKNNKHGKKKININKNLLLSNFFIVNNFSF